MRSISSTSMAWSGSIGYSALQADSGGLVVSFGLDKAQAFTEIQHRTRRDILLIALSTSLVLVLTSLGARRFIHRPLGQLVDCREPMAARRLCAAA